jgi:hypothetical protein
MCVILYTNIDGVKILAKNRDRTYKPTIEIIHEIINGIELAYIRDIKTGWVEGMNEHGTGIVNATLNMKDSKDIKTKRKYANDLKKSNIYNALCEKNKNQFFTKLMENNTNNLLEGNSLLTFDDNVYHTENNLYNKFYIKNIKDNEVYSNHGIILKNEGYKKGKKGLSSFLRKKVVENELSKLNENDKHICKDTDIYDKISNILNKNYINIDPRFHPYRDKNVTLSRVTNISKNSKIISTTGQLILNVTNKELVYLTDVHNSKNVEYVNKLPKDYIPKIRIIIKETEKNTKPTKMFTQKYLKSVYNKFSFNETNKNKTLNNKTNRNKTNKNKTNRNKTQRNKTKRNKIMLKK